MAEIALDVHGQNPALSDRKRGRRLWVGSLLWESIGPGVWAWQRTVGEPVWRVERHRNPVGRMTGWYLYGPNDEPSDVYLSNDFEAALTLAADRIFEANKEVD